MTMLSGTARTVVVAAVCALAARVAAAPPFAPQAPPAFLFSYFTGNGEDGLHLLSSRDGMTWTPLKGGAPFLAPAVGGRLMRDPSLVRGPDGTFHLVWTTGWWDKGIGIAHSKNLIAWSGQESLPVMAHEPGAENCWAPEIFYDDDRGRFLILWATTIRGRFPATDPKNQTGERSDRLNHRIYYVETKDFLTYSAAALLYDGGFNAIDAFLIKAAPGRYVLVVKDETAAPTPRKHLRLAEAKQPEGPYGPASAPISIDWVEGPSALKVAGGWMVYYDEYTRRKYGAIRSSDLTQWTAVPTVSFPPGVRHGTALAVPPDVLAGLVLLR